MLSADLGLQIFVFNIAITVTWLCSVIYVLAYVGSCVISSVLLF